MTSTTNAERELDHLCNVARQTREICQTIDLKGDSVQAIKNARSTAETLAAQIKAGDGEYTADELKSQCMARADNAAKNRAMLDKLFK